MIDSPSRHVRRWKKAIPLLVCALLLAVPGPLSPAAAQDGTGLPGTTIHVVQRDENLYRIALLYNTTVEAIAEANGISDPRYISVGQRLLIPNTGTNAAGIVTRHRVEPGQTLATIANYYAIPLDEVAAASRITNPALIFAGQNLVIPLNNDPTTTTSAPHRALHHVQPGENLAQIALRHQVSLAALLRAHHSTGIPVFAGQTVWIPGENPGRILADLAVPFVSYALMPLPAIQGKTLSIQLATTEYAMLTGTFMGYPVQLVTQDATQHYALFGIHTFAAPGVYPLILTATTADGRQTTLTQLVRVDSGGYGAEEISLATEQQDLLTPQVTEPEWEKIARLMSSFTAQRYFEGVMGLPSPGAITSQFGTRRTYNGGVLNTFHSGTDFAGGPGSIITAPAAGVVILTEALPVRGNTTLIDHGWGVVTGYFHQSEMLVAVGDVVAAGTPIGTVGTTGRSTGPHLHWEMWVGGVQVDPMQWVQRSFP